MDTASPSQRAISAMRWGILVVNLGVGVTLFTYLKSGDLDTYVMFTRVYRLGWGVIALGLFEMISGYVRGRGVTDPVEQSRVRSTAAFCLVVLVVAAIAGTAAWRYRAPFWSAVEMLSRGDDAAARLRTIAERHAATMESGAGGLAALKSWKESAEGAIPLRADFAAAAEAARYLETAATGSLKTRAGIDAQFYALCIEWADLYSSIARRMAEESMIEPPEEWTTRQNALVDRIEALPPLPKEGS